MTWSTSSRTWRSSTRRAGCWQTSKKGEAILLDLFVCAPISLFGGPGWHGKGCMSLTGMCGLCLIPQRERVCGGL